MATHHTLTLLSLLFTCLLSSSVSAATHRCHPNDYKALMEIKKAFNNPYIIISWKPNTDCCDWYCLKCDEKTNRVYNLDIDNDTPFVPSQKPVSGQIPPAIGDLPYLETLILRKLTNLTGTVPRSITKLKQLKFVWLGWTNLSGPVPDYFSELPNLEYLGLNNNQFTGSIPPSFSKLTKLGALHLDRNKLTGSIPESYGHFTGTVPDLYLSHNQLTGPIPKSFAKLDFERIDLSRNKLTGDASILIKPNGLTQTLDISRNMFQFDLSKVKFPKANLISFDINHNKIYGSIPTSIVDVEYLQLFNASYNRLCGKIPTGGRMSRFDYSTYIHNKCLCGPPLTTTC